MRKTLASFVVIAFAGLLSTSLLAIFSGTTISSHLLSSQMMQHAYFMAY